MIIIIIIIIIISDSNWTVWSTIQGVIVRVISKLDKHDYTHNYYKHNYYLNCMTRGSITS